MALRRAIGSLAVRSQAYYPLLCRTAPSPPTPSAPPPSFRRPLAALSPCRPFAAPPQHVKKNTKDEDDDAAGPRINNDITAPFLRLVTDQGHDVVPRHEALQLAARMGMDLVEVHRKSDPPVCKIMDFHKERYNKDVKEKERLKTKSAIVLRGGENKEVRFKGKTCMAMPAGNEEEDLGGPLSRLLGLIQDVCIVESGPHLDSKHAYVIVRHVKFATKKGGKKASKAMEDAGKGTPRNTATESAAAATDSGDETSEHGLEIDGVNSTAAYLSRDSSTQKEGRDRGLRRELKSNPGNNRENAQNMMNTVGSRINPGQGGPHSPERGLGSRSGNPHTEKQDKTTQDMAPGETNRYASRRQQIGGDNQGRSPQDPRRDGNEDRYRFNDNQRPLEQPNRPLPRFSQGRLPQEPRRNETGSHIPLNNNQRQFQQSNPTTESVGSDVRNPTSTARSLGVFSSRKPATSELKKTDSVSDSKHANTGSTKSFGIFSSPRRESGDKRS
ncbi:hypothetical protein BRADI_3g00290v3 [Brachypodium distachyon]|uniref:Translation initiation factor 3 N-terminal domain-containing protein n=1 Tax=Brachypodium distachyon TaxID=15368 RepID=A0A2K2CUE0_BRADI|nr:hypothetical protein BRADI_3g00290v3 [Brachypodium distachyon]